MELVRDVTPNEDQESDRSQHDYSTVWIKEEHDSIEDDDLSMAYLCEKDSVLNIKQENDAMDIADNVQSFNTAYETNCFEDTQIKEEITVEEAKVEDYSESEDQGLKFSCNLCNFHCGTNLQLRKHVTTEHPEETPTRCTICHEKIKGASQLEKHIEDKHQGLGNKCIICLVQYKKGQWNEHKTECLGRLLFDCNICKESYLKKEGLYRHLDEHGVSEEHKESSITALRVNAQYYSCIICDDDKAYTIGPYRKHAKDQHGGQDLYCPDCGQSFKNNASRRKHMMKYCKVGLAGNNTEAVECPQCSRTCQNRVALEDHIIKNHAKKPFQCNECEKEFPNTGVLRYHKIKVHLKPSLSCTYCSQKFRLKYELQKHMVSHKNQEVIQSTESAKFQSLGNLQMKQHDQDSRETSSCFKTEVDEDLPTTHDIAAEEANLRENPRQRQSGPTKCKICLAEFNRGTKHKAKCSGRQLFSCNNCKNLYVTRQGLWKHLDEHGVPEVLKESSISDASVMELVFSCVICEDDRAFREEPYWKHVEVEHSGRHLRCPDCRKTFKTKANRHSHMKRSCKIALAREKFAAD